MIIEKEIEPAYITIVEGPPPHFRDVEIEWTIGVLEGFARGDIALCEMRTLNGPQLVERCQKAWKENRPALFDFPLGEGKRRELNIVAIRWHEVEEGQKVLLWLKV